MWNKETQSEVPGTSPSATSRVPATPLNAPAPVRPGYPTSRNLACLGSTIVVKGEISGDEDLQIDGKIEGPISLQGHRLTIGRSAQLSSQALAREVIVYGKATGNLRASDRVEIKKDGEVTGDITTARISIEDGAYFKGRIEIERGKVQAQRNTETNVPVSVVAD
jgi:cytoskeletal protein CcmA (bactofilin family)